MGLGVSHDCFDGSYSSFATWRIALALAAGFPPLEMMEGYHRERESGSIGVASMDQESWRENTEWFVRIGHERIPASLSRSLSPAMQRAVRALPLKWDLFKDDPLTVLLTHSDCDGRIEHKHLKPLADRLRELMPSLPDEGPYAGLTARGRTQQFIEGLLRAHELGEDVEFH
jgi:hypothetical protein